MSNICRNLIKGSIVTVNGTVGMRYAFDHKIGMYSSSIKCMCRTPSQDALIHGIKTKNSWESIITRDYLVGSQYYNGLLLLFSPVLLVCDEVCKKTL